MTAWMAVLCLAMAAANHVVDLTADNFGKLVSKDTWLVKFYAPWCGHCKRLEPVFEEAAKEIPPQVHFGRVDCTADRVLCNGIRSYPTLKIIRDTGTRDYTGGRSVGHFVSFAETMAAPAVIHVTANDLSTKFDTIPVAFLLLSESETEHPAFSKAARTMQGILPFLHSSDKDLYQRFGVEEGESVVAVVTEGKEMVTLKHVDDEKALMNWVEQHQFPLVSDINRESMAYLSGSKLPLLLVFAEEGTSEYRTLRNELLDVGKAAHGRYAVGLGDRLTFSRWIENVGITDEAITTGFVFDEAAEKYYLPQEHHRFHTKEEVQRFIEDVLRGDVPSIGPSLWSPTRLLQKLDDFLSSISTTNLLLGLCAFIAAALSLIWFTFPEPETEVKPKEE